MLLVVYFGAHAQLSLPERQSRAEQNARRHCGRHVLTTACKDFIRARYERLPVATGSQARRDRPTPERPCPAIDIDVAADEGRRTAGRTVGLTVGRTAQRKRLSGRTNGRTDERTDGGRMDGRTDGRTDGRMDERT